MLLSSSFTTVGDILQQKIDWIDKENASEAVVHQQAVLKQRLDALNARVSTKSSAILKQPLDGKLLIEGEREVEENLAQAQAKSLEVSRRRTELAEMIAAKEAELASLAAEVETLTEEAMDDACADVEELSGEGGGFVLELTEEATSELEAEATAECARGKANRDMEAWYTQATSSLEILCGFSVKVAETPATPRGDPELVLDFGACGADAGQIRIALCLGSKSASVIDARMINPAQPPPGVDLQRVVEIAQAQGSGAEGLRAAVRELRTALAGVKIREAHIAALGKPSTAVTYNAARGELVVTIDTGVTALIRLSSEYPMVPGGAWLVNLEGVGGWSEQEMSETCAQVNALCLTTLEQIMSALYERTSGKESGRRQ